ncbi:hypothetical protein ACFWJU_05905 [Streptomyces mutabilis]|uniref:hypothetical protein n=1 Tax=Streptomyces mutabilis TaxID=67332 RepID=UPI003669623F
MTASDTTARLSPEREAEMAPVGYYCDHSDEPANARTHHDWEFIEGESFVFQPRPETTSAFTYADRPYLKPEDRETRCARAVPLYAAPALLAELAAVRAERDQARERVAELERPTVQAKRNEIRQSFTELIAAAEETKDYEGAFDVQCRLREREEQWKREDEEPVR